jgi:MOSC domain-containing protein YiiM
VDPAFPRRFAAAGRPAAYLRIVHEGSVATVDEVKVFHRLDHQVTLAFVARA